MGMFTGKTGLVLGVANDRSIAWSMSEALYEEGAELGFSYLPGEQRAPRSPTGDAPQRQGGHASRRPEGRGYRGPL